MGSILGGIAGAAGLLAKPLRSAFAPGTGHKEAAKGAEQAQQDYRQLGYDLGGQYMGGYKSAMESLNPYESSIYSTFGYTPPPPQQPGSPPPAPQPRGPLSGSAYGSFGPQDKQDLFARYDQMQRSQGGAPGMQPQQGQGGAGGTWKMPTGEYDRKYSELDESLTYPSATAFAYGKSVEHMGNPSNIGAQYGRMQQSLSGPSNTQSLYSQDQGGFGRAGLTESWRPQMVDASARAQMELRGALGGQSALDQASGGIGGLYGDSASAVRGAAMTEGLAGRSLPGLESEGMHEQFVRQAMSGDNPYFRQLEDEGLARLNQEMARRGHFASGGAAIGNARFLSGLKAEQFRNMSDMTRSAQDAGINRLNTALGFAQGADKGALARSEGLLRSGQAQSDLAKARDLELRERQQMLVDAADRTSRESLASQGLDLEAVKAADQTRLSRLAGIASLARSSDDTALAREMGLLEGAQGVDAEEGSRLDRMLKGAGQRDEVDLARTTARAGLAEKSQQFQREQEQALRDEMARLAAMRTGLTSQFYSTNAALMADLYGSGINAGANAAQLRGQGTIADQRGFMEWMKFALGLASGGGGGKPPVGGVG